MKAMCDPIFRPIGVWDHSLVDMLCFRIIAGLAATVVDMHVSPHRCAYQVTQHRSTVVICQEFASLQLEAGPIWPIDSPPCA